MSTVNRAARQGLRIAIETLLDEAEKRGLPLSYKTDLEHDRTAIEEGNLTSFVWGLRECGTDIYSPHVYRLPWFLAAVKVNGYGSAPAGQPPFLYTYERGWFVPEVTPAEAWLFLVDKIGLFVDPDLPDGNFLVSIASESEVFRPNGMHYSGANILSNWPCGFYPVGPERWAKWLREAARRGLFSADVTTRELLAFNPNP